MNTIYKIIYILLSAFWSTFAVVISTAAIALIFFPVSFWFGVPSIVTTLACVAGGLWLAGFVRVKWVRIIKVERYVA